MATCGQNLMNEVSSTDTTNFVWRKRFVGIFHILYSIVVSLLYVTGLRSKPKSVRGETVLITGAGSGMGRLLALRFADLGCRLVLWDINAQGNEETAKQVRETTTGAEVYTYVCDVSRRENVYEVAKKVKAEVGDVTILVNNAGIVSGKRLLDTNDESIVRTFAVNSLAQFWTCKAFLPAMMQNNHGHLVSIASLAGHGGVSQLTDYCASKAAAVGFEESLRLELALDGYTGIYSTSISPFFVNTGMFEGVASKYFSILTPEYVVDKIIDAVLHNKAQVIIPRYFVSLIVLKWILPSSWYLKVHRALGGGEVMMQFVGRKSG